MSIDLGGEPGEFRFTVTVTRAETGKQEVYECIGKQAPQPEDKGSGDVAVSESSTSS